MKMMVRPQKSKDVNESKILFLDCDFDIIDKLELESLPSSTLIHRQELIRFCFLLLLLKEEQVRKVINKSRITIQFWTEFRTLHRFHSTFTHYSDKELINAYKYIYFYPVHKSFSTILIVKAYFYLDSINSFTSQISLAELGKEILNFLKKLTRKNSRLYTSSIFDDLNFMKYYNNQSSNELKYHDKLHSNASKE